MQSMAGLLQLVQCKRWS